MAGLAGWGGDLVGEVLDGVLQQGGEFPHDAAFRDEVRARRVRVEGQSVQVAGGGHGEPGVGLQALQFVTQGGAELVAGGRYREVWAGGGGSSAGERLTTMPLEGGQVMRTRFSWRRRSQ